MFPSKITMNNEEYLIVQDKLDEIELKELLLQRPYEVYAMVNESIEEQSELMLTTFLVLHTNDFGKKVILYDVSRERHSTVTTKIGLISKGYVEMIEVGIIDRFPIVFYAKEEE